MTDLHHQAATEIARRIADGELTSREVAEQALARIRELNPRVNAVVDVVDDASANADAIDSASASGTRAAALRGVPITIKDALHVSGRATTWGNPEWRDARAHEDAAVVARLRAAGTVLLGKTNVAMMLGDFGQSTNPLYGTTNNPWDLDRSVGGSSGGAAAAVACGMSFLDYGSDVVGSVRIPAALCGIYGLKPTPGLVPLAGLQPPGPPAPNTPVDHMASLGPLARTPADIRAALTATTGLLAPAAAALSWRLPLARHARLTDFRVGVVLDDADAAVTPEVGDVLSALVDRLGHAGVKVRYGWPEDFDTTVSRETFDYLLRAYFAFKQGSAQDGPDLNELISVDRQRRDLQFVWDAYFRDVDVLLCPTTVATAQRHDPRPMPERTIDDGAGGTRPYTDLAAWVPHASIAGLPALSAPVGLSRGGLPVGIQIIGPRYEEDTVITFAEHLVDIVGPAPHPPI